MAWISGWESTTFFSPTEGLLDAPVSTPAAVPLNNQLYHHGAGATFNPFRRNRPAPKQINDLSADGGGEPPVVS